jgi:hypothetical protein
MADAGGKEQIALDVAERLGEFGARLTALEQTQHRDKQETNAQLREMRDILHRIETRERPTPATTPAIEMLLGRMLDVVGKPTPPPSPVDDIAHAVAAKIRADRGGFVMPAAVGAMAVVIVLLTWKAFFGG